MRLFALALIVLIGLPAEAEVLCVRAKKNGVLSGALKVRQACKKREVQVDGSMFGLCCNGPVTTTSLPGATTTLPPGVTTTVGSVTTSLPTSTTVVATSTSTSLTCPTVTSTTLGVNPCGGNPPTCLGLCPNARGCVNDGVACSCTGPLLPCGAVTNDGMCGGTCPPGEVCSTTPVIGTGGCPEALVCGCVAP